MTKVSHFYV